MLKNILKPLTTNGLSAISVGLLAMNFLFNSVAFAQNEKKDSPANVKSVTDSVKVNATTKTIFSQAKKLVSEDQSTIMSIIMIVCVLTLVVIALWLSFRSPSSSDKRKKVMERQQQRKH